MATFRKALTPDTPAALERLLLRTALAGLPGVALLGVLMRFIPLVDGFPLQLKHVMHAHSHFAFGGWVAPILLWMLLRAFPVLYGSYFRHWRAAAWITMISACGMLLSFPFGGYGLISIFFSTLSMVAGFYTAWLCWKGTAARLETAWGKFLRAGVLFLLLSSLGPLATGPLMAAGMSGTPLYFNAIYGYLHFQYNGWFTMVIFAVIYGEIEQQGHPHHGRAVLLLVAGSCLPAYALSLLWMGPPAFVYVIGGIAAALHLAGLFFLLQDVRHLHRSFILRCSLLGLAAKGLVQLASALPPVAAAGYMYRNFFIAYLHLVLVGFVTLFALHKVLLSAERMYWPLRLLKTFIVFFVLTELLLVLDAALAWSGIHFPHTAKLLFWCSLPLPLCAGILWWKMAYRTPPGCTALAAAA